MPIPHRPLVVVSLSLLVACASSPGNNPPSAELPPGTFTTGLTSPSGAGIGYPLNGNDDAKWQALYLTSEVGAAGSMTGLKLHRGTAYASGTVTCPSVMVRLGHTTLDPTSAASLTTTFASNVDAGSLTTVFSGALTISAPNDAWFDVPFTTPFGYDGVDNLLVEIETYTRCSGPVDLNHLFAAAGYRRTYSSAPDATPNGPDHSWVMGTTRDGFYAAARFTFAGGDLRKDLGGTSGSCWPLSSNPPNGLKQQSLYLASDLNGAGPVTGLGFQLSAPSYASTITTTVRMGHSTLTQVGATFASNVSGDLVTVADHLTWFVAAGMPTGSWIWVPLDRTFTYDGVRNLVVQVETTQATGNCQALRTLTRAGARAWANASEATTGSVDTGLHHVALRFAGAPVVLAPIFARFGGLSGLVLGGLSPGGQIQSRYPSSYLGTGGTIRRLAVRYRDAPVPTTVPGVSIYLGTTAKASLSGTFRSSMDGATLVYSGTLTVPPGVVAGDWLDVPLQTGFAYDPSQHLVVLFGSNAAPTNANTVQTWQPSDGAGRNDNSGLDVSPSWLSGGGGVALKVTIAP